MNIYGTEGDLDIDKANIELRATGSISNDAIKRQRVAELQTAALLSVADSLRTLAIEAALSMSRNGDLAHLDGDEGDPFATDSLAVLNIVAGQRVRHETHGEGHLTGGGGMDQGEAWAEVAWDDGSTSRAFASYLTAVLLSDEEPATPASIAELAASPVPLVGVATETEAPELLDEAGTDEDGQPAVGGYDLDSPEGGELVDDIDADFDGDNHAAAADAVAALKARRKAAKGKGK